MSKHILISRTDAIGDVVLTLPMCGLIKANYPSCKISFLGNSYTRDIINASEHVDHFIDFDTWDKFDDGSVIEQLRQLNIDTIIHVFPRKRIANIAFKAGIRLRIGTRNRIFHWLTCNKLMSLSRKNSGLHEAQLNLQLLKALDIKSDYLTTEIPQFYGFGRVSLLSAEKHSLLSLTRFNLLIHPKSRGSAMEWSLDNYSRLIELLNPDKYKIFITGSEKEQVFLSQWIKRQGDKVTDITGKFGLEEFISFIKSADGLVASSTGPLHIAAATGIYSLGLYTNGKSVNADRWSPVGEKAEYIEAENADISSIDPQIVFSRISKWHK